MTGSVGGASNLILGFVSYFIHWSSVGGLVGFALSRKSRGGILIGAISGAILAALLMCL